jgi:hypothetical protein
MKGLATFDTHGIGPIKMGRRVRGVNFPICGYVEKMREIPFGRLEAEHFGQFGKGAAEEIHTIKYANVQPAGDV